MNATQKQINEIARASKYVCAKNGMGNQVVIFSDFSWTEATGSNDTVARGKVNGDWDYPILRVCCPMTRKVVSGLLGQGN